MTVVNIDLAGPTGLPEAGALSWKPTTRFKVGSQVRLPDPVSVPLVAGMASVDLTPSESWWAWQVIERVNGGKKRVVQVPTLGPVAYAGLVEVDPSTFLPFNDVADINGGTPSTPIDPSTVISGGTP